MSRVSVSLLTCSDMDGHELLRTYGPLATNEITTYFHVLRGVLDRWFASVGRMGPAIYADYHENGDLLNLAEHLFKEVLEEDDPVKAWKIRDNLDNTLSELSCVMRGMGEVFSTPRLMQEFYNNLPARLRATYQYMLTDEVNE